MFRTSRSFILTVLSTFSGWMYGAHPHMSVPENVPLTLSAIVAGIAAIQLTLWIFIDDINRKR